MRGHNKSIPAKKSVPNETLNIVKATIASAISPIQIPSVFAFNAMFIFITSMKSIIDEILGKYEWQMNDE